MTPRPNQLVLLLILFFLCCNSSAQKARLTTTLKSILSDSTEIPFISWEALDGRQYIPINEYPFNTFPQILVKNKRGLYVFLNGSGRLYQLTSEGDSVAFKRIDSTVFYGYNFGSFAFTYHDSIYSLGGYGMWRINGQLRVFISDTRQWEIVKLNEELPILYNSETDMDWYDSKNNKIYFGYTTERNEAVRTKALNDARFLYNTEVLDLTNMQWHKLGKLSSYFRSQKPLLKDITATPWGQLASLGNRFIIIDYSHNTVLYLKPEIEEQLRPLVAAIDHSYLYYFKDSLFYFGSSYANRVDSFQLHAKDFIPSREKIYTTNILMSPEYWFTILAASFIAISYVLIIKIRRKRRNTLNTAVPDKNGPDQIPRPVIFDEKELKIITLLLDNSVKGLATSVEEINKQLGVSKKNFDLQKKQRSDTIISINEKYHFICGTEDNLVEKRRSEMDRRSFEYFIPYSKINQATDMLKNMKRANVK